MADMWGIATTSAATLGEQCPGPRRPRPRQLVCPLPAELADRPCRGGAKAREKEGRRVLPDRSLTLGLLGRSAGPKEGWRWRIWQRRTLASGGKNGDSAATPSGHGRFRQRGDSALGGEDSSHVGGGWGASKRRGRAVARARVSARFGQRKREGAGKGVRARKRERGVVASRFSPRRLPRSGCKLERALCGAANPSPPNQIRGARVRRTGICGNKR
jgi:hypothetical protein